MGEGGFGGPKLIVEITGDVKGLQSAYRKAGQETETMGRKFGSLAKMAGATAGVAAIGGLVVAGEKFAKAAMEAQEETGKLDKAFENAGMNAHKMSGFVDKAEAAQRKLGFTNNDTRDALTKFITAGDNTQTALKDMALASDYARFKGISLADASLVLVKAHTGNTRALKALGLSMAPVTTAMDALKEAHKKLKTPIEDNERAMAKMKDANDTYQNVAEKLNKAIGGQAEEFSKSAKGGMEEFHAQMHALEEQAGKHLLPVIAKVAGALGDLMGIFADSGSVSDKFTKALERFGVSASTAQQIVQGFTDAFAVIKPAAEELIRIMKLLATEVLTPLKVIIDLIHGDWSKAWNDLLKPVTMMVGLVKDAVTGLASAAWNAFSSTFEKVFVTPFQTAWGKVSDWYDSAAGFVGKVASYVGGLPKRGWDAFVATFEKVFVTPFKAAWNAVADWIGGAKGWVMRVADFVGELPSKIVDFGKDLLKTISKFFTDSGVAKFVTDRVAAWADFIYGLPGKVKDFGSDLLKKISDFVTNSGIAKFLGERITAFANFFESLPGKIGDALSRGVKGAVGKIKGWFSDLFGWLPGWAKDILDIHSPSKVFEEIGVHIVEGLIKGLGGMAGALQKKVEDIVKAPIAWAQKAIGTIGDLFTGGVSGSSTGVLQLPATFSPTHDTANLPGYPAIDVMVPGGVSKAGTGPIALSPAAGKIVKESGRPFSQGWSNGRGSAIGLSMYLLSKAGEYFLTHFESLYQGVGATVAAGQPLGVVGPMDAYGVGAHIHEGFHAFAKGGIVRRPTVGLIGEAGPEAVIPLDRGLGTTIHIHVAGSVVSENQLLESIYSGLVRKSRRNAGNLGLA